VSPATVFERIGALRSWLEAHRVAGRRIGLVPTMGYLHAGHASLIRRARQECDIVVVSVFVNPTQFGPGEDYDRYPRDLEHDQALCEAEGADAIFAPPVVEMYPTGAPCTRVTVARVSEGLCGRSRPHHFAGVATVVTKLLNIVQPHRAYFGEKDYQQLAVIRTMVADLNLPVDIVGCPTVRESDGLAMSSRNSYLSPELRARAPAIYRALCAGRDAAQAGERSAGAIAARVKAALEPVPDAAVEYVEVVDAESLAPLQEVGGGAVIAVAVRLGGTRLIDNIAIKPVP